MIPLLFSASIEVIINRIFDKIILDDTCTELLKIPSNDKLVGEVSRFPKNEKHRGFYLKYFGE